MNAAPQTAKGRLRAIRADVGGNNSSTPATETYGAVFPTQLIEAVADPKCPEQLRLQTWDGHRAKTESRVFHQGQTYVAGPIKAGLAQAVRFPPESRAFGSVASLVSRIHEVFCRYANLLPEGASILSAFSLASFFADCLRCAPILHLVGPETEVDLIQRLLNCTCRRALLLGDVDMPALASLPAQLTPTLLIKQRGLNRPITRALQASCDQHFRIVRGERILNLYGPKVFSSDAGSMVGPGIEVSISPSLQARPFLTEAAEEEIVGDLQPKLLRYRMIYHDRVRTAKVDCEKFFPMKCEEAYAWLAPLCDCPDLRDIVSKYLLEIGQETAGRRFVDLNCVVAEAALSFCHESDCEEFFVRELADRANALLKGRREESELTDKKAGLLLRDVGIRAQRVTAGYKVTLSDGTRERIHSIATSYQVLSLQDGVERCRHCPGEKQRVN